MKKNNYQEYHFVSGHNVRIKSANKKRMPTIKCVCGAKILVIPDLKAMNNAIRNHISEHKKTRNSHDNFDSLEQFLAEKILFEASKMNLPNIS